MSSPKPCPCCENDKIVRGAIRLGARKEYRLTCRKCGLNTGWRADEESARRVWDRRPEPTEGER